MRINSPPLPPGLKALFHGPLLLSGPNLELLRVISSRRRAATALSGYFLFMLGLLCILFNALVGLAFDPGRRLLKFRTVWQAIQPPPPPPSTPSFIFLPFSKHTFLLTEKEAFLWWKAFRKDVSGAWEQRSCLSMGPVDNVLDICPNFSQRSSRGVCCVDLWPRINPWTFLGWAIFFGFLCWNTFI